MKLTKKQKEEIREILVEYQQLLEEKEVNEENVAAAMMDMCEDLDWVSALSVSKRIHQGLTNVRSFCEDKEAMKEPDFFKNNMEKLTAQMAEGQKKGFLLQCLDALDRKETDEEALKYRASLTVEELEELLGAKAEALTEKIAAGMEDAIVREEARDTEDNGASEEKISGMAKAYLLAAAQYTAALKGTLPQEFAQYPELSAICTMMETEILEYTSKASGEEKDAVIRQVIKNILLAGVGAALLAGGFLAIGASDALFWAMESGILGTLVMCFASVGMVFLFLGGEAMVFVALSNLMDLWKEHKEQRKKQDILEKEATQSQQENPDWEDDEENQEVFV